MQAGKNLNDVEAVLKKMNIEKNLTCNWNMYFAWSLNFNGNLLVVIYSNLTINNKWMPYATYETE